MNKQKGFTLIELLVVIAIIGLLSTMAVVSLNSARAKARDAKRLSDVRQMANVLAILGTEGTAALPLEGCSASSAEKNVMDCTAPSKLTQFNRFGDPSISDPANDAYICTASVNKPCQYAFTIGSTNVVNAEIYFYLETNVAGLENGLHYINSEGVFDAL